MLLHFNFLFFVVCTVRICDSYSFFVLFPSRIGFFVVGDLAAYNNCSVTSLFISLSMSLLRGACGHLKGKYCSHFSCLNCSACSRFNLCVECRSWSNSIWDLADKRRSSLSRKMLKKKESKEKQQKGFSAKRSSSLKQGFDQTVSQDDPAGSSVISHDDESLSGEYAPALSQSSSGGDQRLGNSSVPHQRSHGTKSSNGDSGSQSTHRSTPTRSHPGDLVGKYGVPASATDLEALPFGPNPHLVILPWALYCRIDPLSLGQNAQWKDLLLATGLTGQLTGAL